MGFGRNKANKLWLRRLGMAGTAATALAGLGDIRPAHAQSTENPAVAEILVTARKREERLVDVPLAATVITGDDLLARGTVADPNQLLAGTPGLLFNNTGAPTTSEMSIRGSGTGRATGADSGVGLYRNGVYIGGGIQFGKTFMRADLFDLERAEVLRGTQGALYGRNAVGGAINLISARPVFNDNGRIDLDYGTTLERKTLQVVINHAFNDEIAVRLGLDLTDQDKGFFRNLDFNRYQDIIHGGLGRIQVRYRHEKFDLNLLAETQSLDVPGVPSQLTILPTAQANLFPKGFFTPQRSFYSSIPGRAYLNVQNVIANGVYDLGWATLSGTSSWRKREGLSVSDNDLFSTASLAAVRALGNPAATSDPNINATVGDRTVSYYNEAHLTGVVGKLVWLAGFDYLDLTDHFLQDLSRTPTAANRSPGTASRTLQKWKSAAAYGSAGYDFTDQWNVTGEVRYTDDNKKFNVAIYTLGTTTLLSAPHPVAKSNKVDHNITVRFKPWSQMMLYVKEGTGYRVAGVNAQNAPASPPALKPVPQSYGNEDSRTYEIGLKTTLPQGVYIGLAGYRTKVSNALAQDNNGCSVTNACAQLVTNFVTNSGTARAWGVELDSSYRFSLMGGAGRLAASGSKQGGHFKSGIYKGLKLPQTPRYIVSGSASYARPLTDSLQGFVNVNYRAQQGGLQDVSVPAFEISPRETTDLRLGVRNAHWELAGYMNNVTNDNYVLFRTATTLRNNGDLRTSGVQLRYTW